MKVLLVEDNPADATLLMELISEKSSMLKINWVTDGKDALDYIKKDKTQDLVLLDLSLPRVSGYDVLRNIKGVKETKAIPVIILSTSSNPNDIAECRVLGAAGFLSKPHDLDGYEALAGKMAVAARLEAMPGVF